jgi:hypothetical protein
MNTENSISPLVVEAVPKLIAVLTPLSPEDRHRAVSAAMILFGQTTPSQKNVGGGEESVQAENGISVKALAWMKKYAVTREQLEQVFSIESDSIDVIASKMPESGKRKQTVQAYVICGLKSFLKTGDPNFTDAEARELCINIGCHDMANHANYTKKFGSLIIGSKDAGWKLTHPGLAEGAKIVKHLTSEAIT